VVKKKSRLPEATRGLSRSLTSRGVIRIAVFLRQPAPLFFDARTPPFPVSQPVLALLGEKNGSEKFVTQPCNLQKSFIADYVVLGGDLVHRLRRLPKGIEPGRNENAFLAGIRL
jgi:hypothetical protein